MILDIKQDIFGKQDYTKKYLNYINEINRQVGVEKIILLPDHFIKQKYQGLNYKITIPSSSVIVTKKDYLYPQFKLRGIGCGMMVIVLPISVDELSNYKFNIFSDLANLLSYSLYEYIFYRLRLPVLGEKFFIHKDNFKKIVLGDKKTFLKEIENSEFDNSIEYLLNKIKQVKIDITTLNEKWFKKRTVRLRYLLGRYFGGNHYAEFQKIKIIDDNNLPADNLFNNQLVLTIHTACNSLSDLLDKNTLNNYVYKNNYVFIKNNSVDYKKFFLAQQILLNYSRIARMFNYLLVYSYFYDNGLGEPYILLEKNHNFTELTDENIIYRHNAIKLKNNDFGLISGRYDYPSYIVRSKENICKVNETIDHGVGNILVNDKNLKATDETIILLRLFKGLKKYKKEKKVKMLISPDTEKYFEYLDEKDIIKRVVELKPLYNIKYVKKF